MIENIGLNALVASPFFLPAKCINLNRNSFFRRVKMPNNQGHLFIDLRMSDQIIFQIFSKHPQVGHTSPVYRERIIYLMMAVVIFNFFLSLLNITFQMVDFLKLPKHFRGTKLHTVQINVDSSCYTASPRFLHPTPVFEWISKKAFGRDDSDRFIPVLHFDGV